MGRTCQLESTNIPPPTIIIHICILVAILHLVASCSRAIDYCVNCLLTAVGSCVNCLLTCIMDMEDERRNEPGQSSIYRPAPPMQLLPDTLVDEQETQDNHEMHGNMEVKRRRTDAELQSLLNQGRDEGLLLEFDEDMVEATPSLEVMTNTLRQRIEDMIDGWQEDNRPSDTQKMAIMIAGLYIDAEVAWDSKNDYLLARIVGLLVGKKLRAHPNGCYTYHNGAWIPISQFTASQQSRLDKGLNLVRFVFCSMAQVRLTRTWDDVMGYLEHYSGWDDYVPVEDYDLDAKHWACVAAKAMKDFPWRLGKSSKGVTSGIDCFTEWFQSDMPEAVPLLALENTCVKYSPKGNAAGRHLEAVKKEESNHCYVYIPAKLNYRPSQDMRDRMTATLRDAYAGNARGQFKIMTCEALGLLGLCHVQRCNFKAPDPIPSRCSQIFEPIYSVRAISSYPQAYSKSTKSLESRLVDSHMHVQSPCKKWVMRLR